MKRIIPMLLTLCIALSLFAGCSGSDAGTSTTADPATSNVTEFSDEDDTIVIEAPEKETEAPTVPLADSGALGEYEVTIGELEFVQDYEGNPAILIHFTFTNTSKENQSAMYSLLCTAFQNGIGLEDAIITDESIYNAGDLTKDIQPGTTIELTEAYLLSSDTAPVEFYVTEALSIDGVKLGKTFEVTPGGTTILSVAPGVDSAVELGDYLISINSYSIAEDYEGNRALILNMGYTNISDIDSPFYAAVEVTAFQDGIELESAYFIDKDIMDNDSNYLNVLPGAGHGVAEAFVLTSETSPVQIEICEVFSWTDEKISTEIDITE